LFKIEFSIYKSAFSYWMQNLTFCGNILDFSAHGKWRAIIENQTPLSNCPRPTLDKADGACPFEKYQK